MQTAMLTLWKSAGTFDRIDGEIDQWIFSAAPVEAKAGLKQFEIPRFHRTLSEWLNAVIEAGFFRRARL